MPAEFIGFFDRDPLAIRLKDGRGEAIKQGRGELEGSDAFQFREFLEEVIQGRTPGVGSQFLEPGVCEGGCGGVRVGGRRFRRP